jgi:disulfide bond formation protein DsbB
MIFLKRSFVYPGVVFFCFSSLIIAWVAETFFNIKPCALCSYLRYVIGSILFLSLVVCLYSARWIRFLNLLCIAAAFSLSFYHVGVEQRWWEGPAFCSGGASNSSDFKKLSTDEKLEQLRNQLLTARVVRCDQINWRIFGVSATIWNTLLFAALLFGLGRLEWTKKIFTK